MIMLQRVLYFRSLPEQELRTPLKPSCKELTLSNHLIGNSIAADHPAAQIHILGHDAGISTVRWHHDAVTGRGRQGHRIVNPVASEHLVAKDKGNYQDLAIPKNVFFRLLCLVVIVALTTWNRRFHVADLSFNVLQITFPMFAVEKK